MKDLACYGSYDGSNSKCIKCNDNECQKIENLKMKCDERCKKDVTGCDLWDTSYCKLHS